MAILEIKDITFKYEEEKDMIINHVSFSVEEGEFISIVGRNGCGKSTIAKLIVNLIKPTSGEIKFNIDEKKINKTIGYVFQNPDNQFVGNTVADDIAFGLENKLINQKEMDPIIDDVLNKVDMIEFKRYEPQLLSGGQKQRVAIASNLALGLSMIIFDESTSMLDPKGKEEINKLIKLVREENPKMIVIQITHSMDEVLNSDRVIALDKGAVYFDGKPDEFFKNSAVLEYLGISAPFKYALFNHFKSKNIILDINDTYEEMRDKIYGN